MCIYVYVRAYVTYTYFACTHIQIMCSFTMAIRMKTEHMRTPLLLSEIRYFSEYTVASSGDYGRGVDSQGNACIVNQTSCMEIFRLRAARGIRDFRDVLL